MELAKESFLVSGTPSQTRQATSERRSAVCRASPVSITAVRSPTSDCSRQLPARLVSDTTADERGHHVSCAAEEWGECLLKGARTPSRPRTARGVESPWKGRRERIFDPAPLQQRHPTRLPASAVSRPWVHPAARCDLELGANRRMARSPVCDGRTPGPHARGTSPSQSKGDTWIRVRGDRIQSVRNGH